MTAISATTNGPEWDLPAPAAPVPVARWGKDHWSTFAYVETRTVDGRGMLVHDRLRCDRRRHQIFYAAKGRTVALGSDADGARYPTQLKAETPDADGRWGMVELPGHDDYDCLHDAIRAGLIEPVMPAADGNRFTDAWGRSVACGPALDADDSEFIRPQFVTGFAEQWLMAHASYALTDAGRAVAAELRAWKAAGGQYHQFTPSPSAIGLNGETRG